MDRCTGDGPSVLSVVALAVVFTMAKFSEAFLVLRALDVGPAVALVLLVMVVMNVVYSVVAALTGSLSDRMGRRRLLILGLAVLIVADGVLALVATIPGVLIGVALWGLHMGLSQGLLAALVVDMAPSDMRGTAFGLFNLASGVTLLAASVVAGLLWSRMGAEATFLAGTMFALLATAGLVLMASRSPAEGRRPSERLLSH
ncbi:MAG: MFS transporter [Brevundimonas sp.]|nr:MAG: MFS transporter [Brevundimonas sp.]